MENQTENQNKKSYETLFNGEIEGKNVKLQLETGEYNGYPTARYLLEEYSLRDDGQAFTKMIKGEDGQTYFVPDVKKTSITKKTFELLVELLSKQ